MRAPWGLAHTRHRLRRDDGGGPPPPVGARRDLPARARAPSSPASTRWTPPAAHAAGGGAGRPAAGSDRAPYSNLTRPPQRGTPGPVSRQRPPATLPSPGTAAGHAAGQAGGRSRGTAATQGQREASRARPIQQLDLGSQQGHSTPAPKAAPAPHHHPQADLGCPWSCLGLRRDTGRKPGRFQSTGVPVEREPVRGAALRTPPRSSACARRWPGSPTRCCPGKRLPRARGVPVAHARRGDRLRRGLRLRAGRPGPPPALRGALAARRRPGQRADRADTAHRHDPGPPPDGLGTGAAHRPDRGTGHRDGPPLVAR